MSEGLVQYFLSPCTRFFVLFPDDDATARFGVEDAALLPCFASFNFLHVVNTHTDIFSTS